MINYNPSNTDVRQPLIGKKKVHGRVATFMKRPLDGIRFKGTYYLGNGNHNPPNERLPKATSSVFVYQSYTAKM